MSLEIEYPCETCGMVFNSQPELEQHADDEHIGMAWCWHQPTSYFLLKYSTEENWSSEIPFWFKLT